ncbi:VanZ family protein [Salipaludibacillus daqingensis]|uniref:VanZ family protein n=1 Tax=Salipaludibacillus daqingensis TaxID=3041001 RepID=UPI002476CF25|nr:VanZ family protein [Salipaludibacillus daqingensis]
MRVFYFNLKSRKYVTTVCFLIYIYLLLSVSFLGESIFFPTRLYGHYVDISHNLIPFATIGNYLLNFQSYNFDTWFYNTFGNIVAFIPLGILLPLIFDKIRRITQVIFISFMVSLIIEITQYVSHLGVSDVDDIILNTMGGILGFMILCLIKREALFN